MKNPPDNPFNGAPLIPGNPGNSGGKKGRSGRTPEWFKEFCRDMISSPKARAAAKTVVENPGHPHYASMWKALSERGYGKPDQNLNHGVQGGGQGTMTFSLNLGAAAIDGETP